jgi:hypothetical protein
MAIKLSDLRRLTEAGRLGMLLAYWHIGELRHQLMLSAIYGTTQIHDCCGGLLMW